MKFDVVVIGAGLVGSAIAQEFTARGQSVCIVEKSNDVGNGTSKANTAIWHTGFDAVPGSLESKLVGRGYFLLENYAKQAGIPIVKTGAVLVAWDEEQLASLDGLADKAHKNGYEKTKRLSQSEVRNLEPNLSESALGGLLVPDEGIVCTWTTNLAYATTAVQAGATLYLNTKVVGVNSVPDGMEIQTDTHQTITGSLVVNAAGLYSDDIHRMFGHQTFSITPRKGQLIVFDKLARNLVNHIILPVPSSKGKGVLISPTVYGNVILGPTAEDQTDKTDTSTTQAGFESLLAKGQAMLPGLVTNEVTATYAGLRAATEHSDYQITFHLDQKYICVGGIRSTGLTSALAIAEYVAEQLLIAGHPIGERADILPAPMPNIGEDFVRPYQDELAIAKNPSFGEVICHCERVTIGELDQAFDSTIPPCTLEGLRRRTRATMGRCQGFYCGAEVAQRLTEANK
ncbi:MAG: NAD(P)/FAD-dependent oxidoreductase [Actinomycetes bacterium]